jgi:hypothetical protein
VSSSLIINKTRDSRMKSGEFFLFLFFFFFSIAYRIIWRISRPAYSMVRCGRRGLGDGLGEGLGFPKCKFKREDNKRRVLRSEKVEIPWTGFGEL